MLSVKVKGIIYKDDFMKFDDFPEPIERMEFQISKKKYLCMEGFERYVRLKEMYQAVNTPIKGMSKVILMGLWKDEIAVLELNLRTGKITQQLIKKGREYNNRPIDKKLWKKGIKGIPKIYTREELD